VIELTDRAADLWVKRVGTLYRAPRRGGEAVSFEYHSDWLGDKARFSLEPALVLASVIDARGHLSIAKFPKQTDEYSIERWEAIALRLAMLAGIRTPVHELLEVGGQPVLLSRRFDREEAARVPFLSALSMLGLQDGHRGSYPELVDVLVRYGAQAHADAHELYRRMVFNVLISNVDDHLRNHGF
jgi:serine/threonine-protein kinase HipA